MKEYYFKDIMIGFYDGPHATPSLSDEGPIFLGIKNIFETGGIDFSNIRHISENEYPKWTKRVIPTKDDIVFSYEATLHRYALIPEGFRGCLGRRMALIRVNKELVNEQFLYQYFLSSHWKAFVDTVKISGATVERISISKFPNYKIKLPTISVQNKIASILSSYDELIENNKQRIQLLEEMAEEIYKEWFVRLRFPGYETAKIVDGLPEGWEKKQIDSFVKIISGYAFKTQSFDSDGIYKLVTIKNVQDGFFVTQTTDFIDELPKNLKEDCKLKDKDIILSLTGNIGRICMIYGENYVLNQRVAKLKPQKEKYFEFAYLMFRSSFLRSTLENISNGAAQQNLSPIEMGKLEVVFPSEVFVDKFSEITKSFFDEIIILNKKNQLLQDTRDLLLPRLISGKLSVAHLVEEELEMVAEDRAEYNKNLK